MTFNFIIFIFTELRRLPLFLPALPEVGPGKSVELQVLHPTVQFGFREEQTSGG